MTFTHLGEQWLDDWMQDNAFVCWVKHDSPWELEDELIATLSLPLNIKGNKDHLFSDNLSQLRRYAIRQAKETPVANEDNQQRRYVAPDRINNSTDEELGKLIYSRFQHIFDSHELVLEIPVPGPHIGAPPREWIPKAIDDIEELIDSGFSINESCRRVAKEVAAANSIETKTVEMTYRRHQREYWHEEFCRCIITKDLESAVTAFKRLTLKSKQKYHLD
jgi:hypothetical protein